MKLSLIRVCNEDDDENRRLDENPRLLRYCPKVIHMVNSLNYMDEELS